MPQHICFLDPQHWCRRLVVVVAVAPPKVVEIILQLVVHVDGSFLRRGDPFLRRGQLRPPLIGRGHLRSLNLTHERGQRRERHPLVGDRRRLPATRCRRIPAPSNRRVAATSGRRTAAATGRRAAGTTGQCRYDRSMSPGSARPMPSRHS